MILVQQIVISCLNKDLRIIIMLYLLVSLMYIFGKIFEVFLIYFGLHKDPGGEFPFLNCIFLIYILGFLYFIK